MSQNDVIEKLELQLKGRWRHKKRGTTYVTIEVAQLQCSIPEMDGAYVVTYRCENDGRLWARPVDEFLDGRFESLSIATGRPNGGRF